MTIVLDCSITLSWYFEDETTEGTDALLLQVFRHGAIVPSLWRYEVANGLQVAVRKRRISPALRDDSLADLARLNIVTDPTSDALTWSSTLHVAERYGLTVYDASYLELAQRRRLPLATLDRALVQAARAELVPVIGN